jgi:iron(III) transport system substrate-binding protein
MKTLKLRISAVFSVALIASLALLSFSGCKSKTPGLFAYVSLDEEIAQDLLATYEKETGTKVQFVRLSTGEASARLEAEKNNPQASLWLGGVGLVHSEAKLKGLTTPYISPTTEKIPAAYRDKEGYWNGLYLGVLAFAANTEQLQKRGLKAPETWADLLDPKWKGLIQVPNPGTSGTSYNMITTLISKTNEQQAFDYLKALHKNVSQYTRSGAAPSKNVALGESVIAVGYAQDILNLIHDAKAPVQLIYPKDGTGYEIAAVSLIKGGQNLPAAQKLIDWLYGPTAGKVFNKHHVAPLVKDGVQVDVENAPPAGVKLIESPMDWAGKNKQRLIDQWNEKINS